MKILSYGNLLVGNTPTQLSAAVDGVALAIIVRPSNANTEEVFFGDDAVTIADGMPIQADEPFTFENTLGAPDTGFAPNLIYFVSASGGQNLRYTMWGRDF